MRKGNFLVIVTIFSGIIYAYENQPINNMESITSHITFLKYRIVKRCTKLTVLHLNAITNCYLTP